MNPIWVCWIREGESAQDRRHFVGETLHIGRDLACEIRLKGWGIARNHAELRLVDSQVFVHDCGSFAGLKVNDERVRDFGPLIEQDVVQIGAYRLWIDRRLQQPGGMPLHQQPLHAARDPVPDRPETDPMLSDTPGSDPFESDPFESDPFESDPPLSDPSLSDPPLSDPSLSDPPLSDPSDPDPPLSEPLVRDRARNRASRPLRKEPVLDLAFAFEENPRIASPTADPGRLDPPRKSVDGGAVAVSDATGPAIGPGPALAALRMQDRQSTGNQHRAAPGARGGRGSPGHLPKPAAGTSPIGRIGPVGQPKNAQQATPIRQAEKSVLLTGHPSSGEEACPSTPPLPLPDPAWSPPPQAVGWLRAAAFTELDRRGLRLGDQGASELAETLRDICRVILASAAGRSAFAVQLDSDQEDALIRTTLEECLGFGPIQPLIDDPSIDEIMVNGAAQIYVERSGILERCDRQFSSEAALRLIAERIASRAGKRLDTAAPTMDARLADGSRVNLIIPPLALRGTHMTIRKFSRRILSFEHLITKGSATPALCSFLEWAVASRLNILVSGGTGSGKTTLLNILGSQISPAQRIITIEDAAELALGHPHCISLEARLAGYEGVGEISIRELLRNALRMRPDRIIIGECRGGEALDLLQALNTGHAGSMSTIHANSPRDALARLEVLTLLSGVDIPVAAIRSQIASAFNLVVQIVRSEEGKRTISAVSELCGLEGGSFRMQDIFVLESRDATGSPCYALCTGIPDCLGNRPSPGSEEVVQLFSRSDGAQSTHAVPRFARVASMV